MEKRSLNLRYLIDMINHSITSGLLFIIEAWRDLCLSPCISLYYHNVTHTSHLPTHFHR